MENGAKVSSEGSSSENVNIRQVFKALLGGHVEAMLAMLTESSQLDETCGTPFFMFYTYLPGFRHIM